MITARLFRLYRLAAPVGGPSSASKKILEPTLRRFAFSCPDISAGRKANPLTLSWTRYCSTVGDKRGETTTPYPSADASTECGVEEKKADAPAQVEVEAAAAAVVAAAEELVIDPPAIVEEVITISSESIDQDSIIESVADDATTTTSSDSPTTPVETAASVATENSDPSLPPSTNDDLPPIASSETTSPPPPPPPPPAGLHVHTLSDRALIRIEGSETQMLLQGLVTQDLELLNQTPTVYAMMLNLQGRVLYDVLIYNVSSPRSEIQKYLLECDAAVASEVVSHLKKYKLRKNCEIKDVSDVYEVSSVRPTTERMTGLSSLPRKSEFAEAFDPILIACRDPRLKDIGWRLISGKGFDVPEALGGGAVTRPHIEYREQRYKLGVAEGINDLEPGKTFPLESNLVFLNGVSFSKGCYLGQELTARTHHTGVIRKRIMPLIMSAPISPELGPFPGNLILNTTGKDAGKFRDGVGIHGIGLVRVNMSGGRLIIVGKGRESECYARMPTWWPMDDPAAVLGGGEEEEEAVEEAGEKTAQSQTSS